MLKFLLINNIILLNILFADFSDYGPYEVEISSGLINPENGGSTQYNLFHPVDAPISPHLILAHEFVSTHDYIAELSQHYASWGIRVATMNLLHSSIFDNNQLEDALDLIWLSDQIFEGGPVIYSGYSAGGLRAIISASLDPDAIAFLGLDFVNFETLAQEYIENTTLPFYGLAGEPSSCNSQGNGINAYAQAENSKLILVTEADHCDFQSPSSLFCSFLCEGENNQFTPDQIKRVIKNLSTAFLTWQANLNPEGELWWTSGNENYENLINNGSISELVSLNVFDNAIKPNGFHIYQNYPNPFNPNTRIEFDLINQSFLDIKIYNIAGRVVKTLFRGFKSRGKHNISWNALDNMNKKVSSGIYIYEIKINGTKKNKKMILLK